MSIVNNSLKWCITSLTLCFRKRLTDFANDNYLKEMVFYKMSNLDNRIQNPDQLIAQDIEKFSFSLSHLFSDIAKPLVDIGLFAYKLSEAIGKDAPLYMIAYFATSALFLRSISPPFGKYVSEEQKMEGDFRFTHSRIIANAEEIAFYRGAEKEKEIVKKSFEKIVQHAKKIQFLRFSNGIIDSAFVKYYATILAYYLLSRPVFDSNYATELMGAMSKDPAKIMEDYSRNSNYLINLSQAIGKVILAGRDLTKLAGYTFRVSDFYKVMNDLQNDIYQKKMIDDFDINASGRVEEVDGIIEFNKIPIRTPNGDLLVKELTFCVKSGMNCLVTGPNGSGKSSLFRILGGLWPIYGGDLKRPNPKQMFYVPQKPYMTIGTMRDQIIYPDTLKNFNEKGLNDNYLLGLLESVSLGYLAKRDEGFDSIQDWSDVLSGGEKQRIAMARLFYHRPQFAILDECTSAVSIDVEGFMYSHAKEMGITLFTVSHRPSLVKYHNYLLRFDGNGDFSFSHLEEAAKDLEAFDFKKSQSSSTTFSESSSF
ncbi:ABC transporter domain-containing protein [Rozella allomycis CSF55]|nr:ABC transporter domain-containing protein [Rozella allomycis CSF55]|eukprot:EPZ34191.1 ABC transporter domain-containing protein [Rozella allomycis CSF55]